MAARVPCALLALLPGVALAAPEVQISLISKPEGCGTARKLHEGQAAALVVTGWIEASGVKFTEYNASRKMETVLGKDPLLKGLHKGVEGMCVGEKRTVIVPPELAHGDKEMRADFAIIPPNSALRFQVELAAVGSRSWYQHGKQLNVFKTMDTDGDGKLTTDEFTAWFKKHGTHPPADLFKHEDRDGDGFIVLPEFSGPKGPEVHIQSISKPDGCVKMRKLQDGQAAALVLTGWIEESGVKFTEYNASRKMETVLGKDPLLKGLHKGVEGMCIGENRTIVVPPELAHGDKEMRADFATIPPNSALRFQVELAAVGSRRWLQHGKPVNVFKIMDTDRDGKLTTAEFTLWFKKQGTHPPADLFKHEDRDGDGFISLAEFSGSKGQ